VEPAFTTAPGVNFINILRVGLLYERALHRFSVVTFWQKRLFVQKRVHKMLLKLTPAFLRKGAKWSKYPEK
jgi:hypothetical protein